MSSFAIAATLFAFAVVATGLVVRTHRGFILTGAGILLILGSLRLMDFSIGSGTRPEWWTLGFLIGLIGSFLVPLGIYLNHRAEEHTLSEIKIELGDPHAHYEQAHVSIHPELLNLLLRYAGQNNLPADLTPAPEGPRKWSGIALALNHALKAFFVQGAARDLGYKILESPAPENPHPLEHP